MVSVSKPVTTLPSTVPPDWSHRFLSSFMLTRPMRPAVIQAWSPSSNAPMMRPPLMRNVSMLSPCCSAPIVPPLMTKSSRPLPCTTTPVTVPPVTVIWSSPPPWSTLSIVPSLSSSTSFPSPCNTPPEMLPACISRRSLPAPDCTPVRPLIVPRLTSTLSPAPTNCRAMLLPVLMLPVFSTRLPPPSCTATPPTELIAPRLDSRCPPAPTRAMAPAPPLCCSCAPLATLTVMPAALVAVIGTV